LDQYQEINSTDPLSAFIFVCHKPAYFDLAFDMYWPQAQLDRYRPNTLMILSRHSAHSFGSVVRVLIYMTINSDQFFAA